MAKKSEELNKVDALKALKEEFEQRRAAINAERKALHDWYFAEKAKVLNAGESEK